MSERNLSIKAIKYIKGKKDQPGKMEITLKETLVDNTHASAPMLMDRPPTKEITEGLDKLRVHLAILSDYITEKRAKDTDEIEKFHVNGYSIGGKEGMEGVTIMGGRNGRYGHVTLNTPFTLLDTEGGKGYYLIGNLVETIDALEDAVKVYMDTPDPQLLLDLQQQKEPVTHAQIAEPEVPVFKEGSKETGKGKNNLKKVVQSAEHPSGQAREAV